MTLVGPYEFSLTDVRKTLLHAIDVLDHYPPASWPCQAARRTRITTALDGLDTAHGDLADLEPALELVWSELLAARDDLVACDVLPATSRGSVEQLSLSDGGLPKRAVETVDVDFGGVVGDRQATRAHHGRPWQALCLWSSEVIGELASRGHPIAPGCAGENVTIAAIPLPDVHPGVRLRIGSILCEVSSYAVPCQQNAGWFADGDVSRIHHSNGSLSRVYATVLEPGTIGVGDDVVLEPA
jgi:MOSC domain-containing protein YiiM